MIDFGYDEWVLVAFVIMETKQPPVQWVGLLVKYPLHEADYSYTIHLVPRSETMELYPSISYATLWYVNNAWKYLTFL